MRSSSVRVIAAASLLFRFASACSGAANVDRTVLTHNDLYGADTFRLESLVVTSAVEASEVDSVCEAIGEHVWSAQTADFLPYLAYQHGADLYWTTNGSCANITSEGLGDIVKSCTGSHSVLCTNSAPLANSTYQNNATYWQVNATASDCTSFTGYRTKDAFTFLGIPYADPFQRWEYSSVRSYNSSNVPALSYGSQCVQAGNVGSEDCLFLNVWTPYLPADAASVKNDSLKAVMFQIHGGAYTGGTGADPGLSGQGLSSRGDVVVVTINYRLTTLGFLALDDGTTNGNYGIGDMVTALQWVQKYIKAFGGDPSRVMIFGQSAGAGATRALLSSPAAAGLFSSAIMESNLDGVAYAQTYSEYITIDQEVQVAADPIANATNCTGSDQLACLRQVNPYLLANLTTVARFVVQDGKYINQPTLPVTGAASSAYVPVMLGFMRDDGASFISFPKTASQNNITGLLNPLGFDGLLTPDVLTLYPIPTNTPSNTSLELYNASAAIATDSEFRCLDLASAYSAVLHGVWPSCHVFTFNRTYNGYDPNPPVCEAPITAAHPYGDPNEEYFKCHSGELAYVFGTIAYTGQPDRDGLDIPMSQMTVDQWTSFARTYDPNPDPAFLAARGFTNTTSALDKSGSWPAVDVSGGANYTDLRLKVFQYPGYEAPFDVFSSAERCESFGFGLDFYEQNPNGNNVTLSQI